MSNTLKITMVQEEDGKPLSETSHMVFDLDNQTANAINRRVANAVQSVFEDLGDEKAARAAGKALGPNKS